MSDSIGSVSVDVVPDARGWSEKFRAQIRDQTVKVNTDADTGEAEAKLDKVARTRTAKVRVNVDKNPLEQGAKSLDSFIGKLGLLPALALTAGAALIPLAGALGGVVAALSAPLAIAGGGATLFAFLGGAAIKQTIEQSKNVDKLKTAVESARQSLENAKRSAGKDAATSASVANAQERLNEAVGKYQVALKGVSPQQKQFMGALDELKSTFTGLINGPTGKALLQPFTDGLGLLAYVLRAAGPVIRASAGAFSSLFESLQQAVASPGFSRFVTMFSRQVGGDIVGFGKIIGNIAKGLGALFFVLDKKAGTSLVDQLVKLTGAFADWASSDRGRHAVQDFLDYFHKVGPQVADTIGAVARGVGHIVAALAPLGPPVLKIVEGISDALAGIPIPVLTALAAATGGLVAFQKVGGLKAVSAISGRLGQNTVGGRLGGLVGGTSVVPVRVVGPVEVIGATGTPGAVTKTTAGVTAGEVAGGAATAGLLSRFGSGLRVLGETLGAPAFISANPDTGNVTHADGSTTPRFGTQFNIPPSGKLPTSIPTVPSGSAQHIRAVATAFDAASASASRASRQIDQIGPHGVQAAGVASHAIAALQNRIDSIHDKRFQVIAQTQSAIQSLERLQALRIADKSFTVYQRNQVIEQAVGPGGGRGRSNPGGAGGGGASGGGSSREIHTHVHLNDHEIGRAITPFVDDVYHANREYERRAAGE